MGTGGCLFRITFGTSAGETPAACRRKSLVFVTGEVKLCSAEEDRAAGLKTDINKCKQLWPWDVIKKNSMSRPHKTITYCYFQAAGVIACRRRDDIHQFGVLLENVDGVLGRCK